jgi:hypothetical protein
MKAYRDALQVPSCPSFIDTNTPIVPAMMLEPKRSALIKQSTTNISGVGNFTLITVPTGKRWTVRSLAITSSSGTWTLSSVAVYDGSLRHKISQPAVSTNIYILSELNSFQLDAGQNISVYADSVTGAGNALCSLFVEEQDIPL